MNNKGYKHMYKYTLLTVELLILVISLTLIFHNYFASAIVAACGYVMSVAG